MFSLAHGAGRSLMGTLATALMLVAPRSLHAQVMTRLELDNDSFNFWQAPKQRADLEYTQGTRIAVSWPTSAHVAKKLLGGPQRCANADAAVRDCRMLVVAATQAIYTPHLDLRVRSPNERPYAGWLGAEIGVQRDRLHSLSALSVSVGVTGAASLAEPGQKLVHRVFGFRPPIGWDAQLPTELAAMITYRGARDLVRVRHARSGIGFMVAPEWRARLGTLATDVTAGLQLIAGVRPPSPWNTAASTEAGRWGLFVRAGAAQHVVARNLFLDGTLFSESRRVEKYPLFGETELGVGVRTPLGLLEWRIHSLGREYRLQPRAHAYSTFAFAVR